MARHGQTIRPGKPEIGHHQIRVLPVDQRHRVGPGVSAKRSVTDALKQALTVRNEIRLVVDHQDRLTHAIILGQWRAIAVPRSVRLKCVVRASSDAGWR
jgi:hypothetical protein